MVEFLYSDAHVEVASKCQVKLEERLMRESAKRPDMMGANESSTERGTAAKFRIYETNSSVCL